MEHEEMLKQARRSYGRSESRAGKGEAKAERFPAPPEAALPPGEFLDRLVSAAFQASPKLHHPFAVRLGRGEWSNTQLREWVRQDYQRTVCAIRRHALVAANSPDYDVIWALITRVKAEADADPVGGVFFALPQLWIKFGISLGLSREDVTGARPHSLFQLLNQAMLEEVRFSGAVPVGDFVNALLDPIFYRIWGDALENSLRLPSDALDYFWAMAGSRWGEETGRMVFERMAAGGEAQTELWNRYGAELEQGREWQRLSILQTLLEAAAS
jgi:hypothetical protein